MISWIFKSFQTLAGLGTEVITRAKERPRTFSIVFALIFTTLFSGFSAIGFAPEPIVSGLAYIAGNTTPVATASEEEVVVQEIPLYPERIIIDAIDLDTHIENPESNAVSVLDTALQLGAVRYPESARLGEDGNMFLFGHSTGFRVVRNQAYKAFNDLKRLNTGDIIRVQSGSFEYRYAVEQVRLVDASEAWVDLGVTEGVRHLTLSTCNTFGEVQERYVVDANFVERVSITTNTGA